MMSPRTIAVQTATVAVGAILLLVAASGGAGAATTKPTIVSIVGRLSQGDAPSRASVERILGMKLRSVEGTEYFAIYNAKSRVLSDGRIVGVELRVPREGAGATAGPLLIVKIDASTKRCISRVSAMKTFAPLTLTGVPGGKSLDEEAYYSRSEPWGIFSIGFAQRSPDCMSSIVFNHSL